MFDILPKPLKDFVDTIFNPPKEFLEYAIDFLSNITLIAGKGINLSNYLGFVKYLPSSFQIVINSLLSAIVFLAILQLVKVIVTKYYDVKEAIKWW